MHDNSSKAHIIILVYITNLKKFKAKFVLSFFLRMAYLNIYVTVKATVTYMLRYAIRKKKLSPNLALSFSNLVI